MDRKKIISININTIAYNNALNYVITLAKNKTASYVCFANAHMTVEAYYNPLFASGINSSTLSLADGMPIVYALNKLHKLKQERIAGIDFMPDVISECEKNKLSIFLFGSSQLVLNKLQQEIKLKYPEIIIAGVLSPPFKQFNEEDNLLFSETINKSNTNVVFVSLGCPKQENWMIQNSELINAPLLGVGAAFEIHAKLIKRAPLWIQKSGLEWLYRFFQEPKRLFKRYLKTNSLFIFLFIKEMIKK